MILTCYWHVTLSAKSAETVHTDKHASEKELKWKRKKAKETNNALISLENVNVRILDPASRRIDIQWRGVGVTDQVIAVFVGTRWMVNKNGETLMIGSCAIKTVGWNVGIWHRTSAINERHYGTVLFTRRQRSFLAFTIRERTARDTSFSYDFERVRYLFHWLFNKRVLWQ